MKSLRRQTVNSDDCQLTKKTSQWLRANVQSVVISSHVTTQLLTPVVNRQVNNVIFKTRSCRNQAQLLQITRVKQGGAVFATHRWSPPDSHQECSVTAGLGQSNAA